MEWESTLSWNEGQLDQPFLLKIQIGIDAYPGFLLQMHTYVHLFWFPSKFWIDAYNMYFHKNFAFFSHFILFAVVSQWLCKFWQDLNFYILNIFSKTLDLFSSKSWISSRISCHIIHLIIKTKRWAKLVNSFFKKGRFLQYLC